MARKAGLVLVLCGGLGCHLGAIVGQMGRLLDLETRVGSIRDFALAVGFDGVSWLGLSANVRDGGLSEFDAGLAVLLDCVAADVRFAVDALDVDAVVVAVRNRVAPELGLGEGVAGDLDAVLVALPDLILDQVRRVVAELDSDLVQVELVPDHLRSIDH